MVPQLEAVQYPWLIDQRADEKMSRRAVAQWQKLATVLSALRSSGLLPSGSLTWVCQLELAYCREFSVFEFDYFIHGLTVEYPNMNEGISRQIESNIFRHFKHSVERTVALWAVGSIGIEGGDGKNN